jgi:hypothetical protein
MSISKPFQVLISAVSRHYGNPVFEILWMVFFMHIISMFITAAFVANGHVYEGGGL